MAPQESSFRRQRRYYPPASSHFHAAARLDFLALLQGGAGATRRFHKRQERKFLYQSAKHGQLAQF
jgi:hypothetical protein